MEKWQIIERYDSTSQGRIIFSSHSASSLRQQKQIGHLFKRTEYDQDG
jgi:hypothetical protein